MLSEAVRIAQTILTAESKHPYPCPISFRPTKSLSSTRGMRKNALQGVPQRLKPGGFCCTYGAAESRALSKPNQNQSFSAACQGCFDCERAVLCAAPLSCFAQHDKVWA